MKKPQKLEVEIKIEKIIPGGQGIGKAPDGKKILLWNALPGETTAEIIITKQKSHYLEGYAAEIKIPSPQRITPRDDCYLSTSPWQIFQYDFELKEKTVAVQELLRQNQLNHIPVKDIVTDHQDFYYRNKMEYSLFFDHDDQKIHLGFHIRGTHQKVKVDRSSIEKPEIFQKATEILTEVNASGRRASDFQSLILRANQNGEVSGGLLEKHRPHPVFPLLKDHILGTAYTYSPNGFFQINLPVYELALNYVKNFISTEKVLDLYSGVGSIGLSVAPDRKLTLVETNSFAFEEMLKNCQNVSATNNNPNITPILAKSEDAIDHIASDMTVILDPPRAGCENKLLEKILEVKPKTVVYMSCNPATLARDLKILSQEYHISEITPFNFFPRTSHIEAVALLSKLNSKK